MGRTGSTNQVLPVYWVHSVSVGRGSGSVQVPLVPDEKRVSSDRYSPPQSDPDVPGRDGDILLSTGYLLRLCVLSSTDLIILCLLRDLCLQLSVALKGQYPLILREKKNLFKLSLKEVDVGLPKVQSSYKKQSFT